MIDAQMVKAIQKAINTVLSEFVANPFHDIREGDVQARLHHEIRSNIAPPTTTAKIKPYGRANSGAIACKYPKTVDTHRVHRELKLIGKPSDIVVYKSDKVVTLSLRENGALDIEARTLLEDVAGVVEIKAAPSFYRPTNKQRAQGYYDDLRKLATLVNRTEDLMGFFVAFDKSLHLGGASSNVQPVFNWTSILTPAPNGRIHAYWVDAKGTIVHCQGKV